MNTRSLRFRLVAWHAGLLTAIFVLLAVLILLGLRHYLEADLRDTQARRAGQIADTLLANLKQTGPDFLAQEIESLYAPEANDRFIRISRQDGQVLYVSGPPKDQSFDSTGLAAAAPAPVPARKVKLPGNITLLIATRPFLAPSGDRYLVEVGAPTTPMDTMLEQLLTLLGIGLPLVVLVGIGGGYLLVGRALAPVDQISRKAERITQHNLGERLPVPRTADELERLSLSLNLMIQRIEDALLNSKRFVADASHELRTPLTVLRAELENLISSGHLTLELREAVGSVLEEVDRLGRIVEQLFALSRLDAGEARAEWVSFDLAELAATTADQMGLLAKDKGIAVSCDANRRVPVKGDRARLKQVVVNLLDNAIKYTPEHGVIQLRVAAINGRAVLEVSDSGIGIPREAVPHIFDRFYRVDQARTRDAGGAGLGLSIVRSICAAHGAEVDVESDVGSGSRFRIRLPLANGEKSP